jgi:hypothetical protein
MPSVGVQLNYNILVWLQAQFHFDWLYLEVSDLTGAQQVLIEGHCDARGRFSSGAVSARV